MKSLIFLLVTVGLALGQTYLRADGVTDTYSLIKDVLGGTGYEVPDCSHPERHISQVNDTDLKMQVFLFSIHLNLDNDRCTKFDRQRVEIKTALSKHNLNGYEGDTMSLSWSFKLDAGFQPSQGFTSIHQVKPTGGDDRLPIVSIGPRYKTRGNVFEVLHVDSNGVKMKLVATPLAPLLGKWLHATEKLKYNHVGEYSLSLKHLATNDTMLSYSNTLIDLWRTNATCVRPKWGIYRSLNDSARLRDEVIRFSDFCIGKVNPVCS